jgi:hypothetical protein
MTVLTPEVRPPYADEFVIPSWMDSAMANVENHYDNVVHVPLPERRYWTIGQTAHDCEQMAMAVQQMFLGTAENPLETTQCNGPRGLTFTMEVVRCTPTMNNRGQAPSASSIESSSVNPVIDMEIMLDVAKYFDEYNSGVIVNVDPITASGGFHGAIATYTLTL